MRRMYRVVLWVLVTMLAAPALLPADGKELLTWPPVKGAAAYKVEIMDGKGKIIDTLTVEEPAVDLTRYRPGDYRIRITTLDRFRKEGGATPWTPFVVRRSPIPWIAGVKPAVIQSGENPVLTVEGLGFISETRAILRGNGQDWPLKDFQVLSATLVRLASQEPLPPGQYTIILVNPAGKSAETEGGLVVSHPAPEIQQVEPSRRTPEEETPLVITGQGFLEGLELYLDDGIIPRKLEILSVTETRIEALFPAGLPEGRYDIKVVNNSWSSTRVSKAVTVDASADSATGQDVAGSDDSVKPGLAPLPEWVKGFSLAAGWQVFLVLPSWSEMVGPSLANGHLMVRYRLKAMEGVPRVLEPMGIWINTGYSWFPEALGEHDGRVEMGVFTLLMGVSWDIDLGRLTLVPAAGLGFSASSITATHEVGVSGTAESLDLTAEASVWLRYRLLKYLALEAGVGYQHQFRAGEPLGGIQISLRVVFF